MKEFVRLTKKSVLVNKTSLQGYVVTSYDNLVKIFGEPESGSKDNKTQCSWVLQFVDDTVATIYDWKNTNIPQEIYKWHIGGKSKKAIENVSRLCPNLQVTHSVI